jgi:glycine cleavage system aminomethyltransferase T
MSVTALAEKMPIAARRGEYRGAETVAAYSDPRTEFAEMVSGCAIYDLGWRAKIELMGKDRVRWLNGMVTNNTRTAPAHRTQRRDGASPVSAGHQPNAGSRRK